MHPTRLGPYTLGTRLGRGGMGAVFEAADDAGHPVAVKLLATHLLDDPALRGRFEAEIATLKTLRHPSIVQLIAFGEDDGQPYFAMELVQGRSLEQLLRAGRRFGWRETVSAAQAVARALKVAHDHGVIHRDLKPANLLVAEGDDGELGSRLKLADFGIAKLFGGSSHTAHGNVVGTAEYMAPEQAAGLPVDPRVDVYALGLVMFAMLAGKPPFVGAEPSEVIRRQQHEAPPRVSTFAAEVPAELDLLIDRMLSKDPAGRPASALALGRLLAAIDMLHQPSSSGSGPVDPSAHRPAAEEVDLYALTRDLGGLADPAAPGVALPLTRAATGAATGNTTKPVDRPSAPGTGAGPAAATVIERGPSSRFTTVAELDRAAEERASRDRAIERRWQAISAAVMLGLFVACGYLLFRAPSADELFARILAARDAAKDGGDLRDAAPVMREFLDRFPDDPRAEQVATLTRSLALDRLERWARRRPLTGRALTPVERDYRAAMEREAESPSTCRDALVALIALHASDRMPADGDADTDDPGLWIDLARRQIDRLEPAAAREQAEDARRIADIFRRADALAADAAQADGAAREDALVRRRELLESVVELYQSRAHAAPAVAEAKKQLGGDAE